MTNNKVANNIDKKGSRTERRIQFTSDSDNLFFIPVHLLLFLSWQTQLVIAGKSHGTRQVVGVLMGTEKT